MPLRFIIVTSLIKSHLAILYFTGNKHAKNLRLKIILNRMEQNLRFHMNAELSYLILAGCFIKLNELRLFESKQKKRAS